MNERDEHILVESVRILKQLAELSSSAERIDYVHRHPIAMSETCLGFALGHPELREMCLELVHEFGYRVKADSGDTQISSNPDRWPIGKGPIESIWHELESGAVSPDHALHLVQEQELAGDLIYTYLKAVADKAYRSMVRGDPQLAAQRQRIIVEATEQLNERTSILDDVEIWRMRTVGGWFWVEITSAALFQLPDGRMFHHARKCAETLLEEAEGRSDRDMEALFLERLGILYLDPYTVNRQITNYDFEMRQWTRKLAEELGATEAEAIEREWPMPAPKEALIQAEAFLERAIDKRDPSDSGTARTALVQCLYYRKHLGEPVTNAEIREQALAGLDVLQLGENDEKIAKLKAMLSSLEPSGEQ